MLTTPPRERERRDWLLLALMAGVVLATIPVARALTNPLRDRFGKEIFLWATFAGLVGVTLLAVRSLRGAGLRARLWILGAAVGLGAFAASLSGNPIEALHLLEYGAVGVLALRALGHRTRDATLYGSAAMLGGILGAVDEATQWLTPDRTWDLRDIAINALAAAWVQLPIAFGVRPDWVGARPGAAGWHRLCGIGLAATLFMGACLAATPPRLAWLGERVPGLGFLLSHPDVMLEYGHLLTLPNGTRTRSRFSADELRTLDAARAEGAGRVLRARGDEERYKEFLAEFTVIGDPFLHELRVHLFRRDRYLQTAERHREPRPWQYRDDRSVALREQEILEAYFPATTHAGGFDLAPEVRHALAAEQHSAEVPYTSRVSEGLVTRWSEPAVLAIPGALGLAFALGWVRTRERAGA